MIPDAAQLRTWREFLLPKLHRISVFLVSQGISMAGNLLYGILCVRLLSVADYAKFVVLFSIQGSLIVLMDIGITGSIVPLVGEHVNDRQMIADYVASLRQVARRLFALIAPITAVVYPLLVRNRHWSWQTVTAMVIIVLVSAWFSRVASSYGAVLILLRDRGRWYRAQMISSLGTLALLFVFHAFHWFSAFAAILINVSGIIYIAGDYFLRSRRLLGVVGVPTREKRAAIMHLTLPSMPGVIFYALQGQLSMMLITIFGRTAGVASVGALTRIGQVFALLSRMNPILTEPYFARLPKKQLKSHYAGAVAAFAAFGVCVFALARFFPGIFLWVLGPRYIHLQRELLLVVTAGCFGLIAGLMASVNGSRRFVYYWQNLSSIVFTLAVQVGFIWRADLSSVRTILWFGLVSTFPSLVVQAATAFYGLAQGGRKIPGIDYCAEEIERV